MELENKITKKYPRNDQSAQNAAYALAEFLDVKKDMITQTMRVRNGYLIQCRGDAAAEWTKYLGMDAALCVEFIQNDDMLEVTVGFERWMEKLGIAAAGAVFFHPLILTAGIGALRSASLTQDIFTFIEEFLGAAPVAEEPEFTRTAPVQEKRICPFCGTENREDAVFCKACGSKLEKEEKHCPSCGALLDGDEAFCPSCGTKLD